MPVMTDALIANSALATHDGAYIANIQKAGQYGFGNHIPLIDGATPLVLRPIQPLVVSAPGILERVEDGVRNLSALVERHSRNIEGIDLTYTMEAATVPAGADGQEMSVPTNARRAGVTPSITLPELTGNLVWNFFLLWQRLTKDADTQASTLAGVVPASEALAPHVMSSFSMDMAFIQYDTTMRPENIIDSYFIVAMWPTEFGSAGFVKTLGQSEHPERQVQFTGVVQHNDNTRAAGVRLARFLNLHTIDYSKAAPAATDIDSVLQGTGIQEEIAQIDATFGQISTN